MYLLRVALPDRPGSLGAVASALGDAHADISAVEIVEKGGGRVIDDFMLTLPGDIQPDALVTAWRGQGPVHLPGGVRAGRTQGRVWLSGPRMSTMGPRAETDLTPNTEE